MSTKSTIYKLYSLSHHMFIFGDHSNDGSLRPITLKVKNGITRLPPVGSRPTLGFKSGVDGLWIMESHLERNRQTTPSLLPTYLPSFVRPSFFSHLPFVVFQSYHFTSDSLFCFPSNFVSACSFSCAYWKISLPSRLYSDLCCCHDFTNRVHYRHR